MSLNTTPFTTLDSNKKLQQWVGNITTKEVLAIDSEFIRTNTYFPKLALIQIATPDQVVLIDPLTISDWQPLNQLLSNPKTTKVFHACKEDIEVLQQTVGGQFNTIVDTQIGAAVAGYGFSMSYSRLVQLVTSVELPKTETISNWLHRPLTDKQMDYAVNDVIWLHALYKHLKHKLLQQLEGNQTRWDWVLEETVSHIQYASKESVASDLYKRIKGYNKLNARQLFLLQQMCIWREKTAQTYDKPRTWVIHDHGLMTVCLNYWRIKVKLEDLANIKNYKKPALKGFGKQVVEHFNQLLQQYPHDKLVSKQDNQILKYQKKSQFKQKAEGIAQTMGINVEILINKTSLNELIYYYNSSEKEHLDIPKLLQGWRRECIGLPLLEVWGE